MKALLWLGALVGAFFGTVCLVYSLMADGEQQRSVLAAYASAAAVVPYVAVRAILGVTGR